MTGIPRAISQDHIHAVLAHCRRDTPPIWQRYMVHFYSNVFSHVPNSKVKQVAMMLKAIHAQESLAEAQKKYQDCR